MSHPGTESHVFSHDRWLNPSFIIICGEVVLVRVVECRSPFSLPQMWNSTNSCSTNIIINTIRADILFQHRHCDVSMLKRLIAGLCNVK